MQLRLVSASELRLRSSERGFGRAAIVTVLVRAGFGFLVTLTSTVLVAVAVAVSVLPATGAVPELGAAPKIARDNQDDDTKNAGLQNSAKRCLTPKTQSGSSDLSMGDDWAASGVLIID